MGSYPFLSFECCIFTEPLRLSVFHMLLTLDHERGSQHSHVTAIESSEVSCCSCYE